MKNINRTNESLDIKSIIEKLSDYKLDFLKDRIESIKEYDFSILQSTSVNLNSFILDINFPEINDIILNDEISKLFSNAKIEDIVSDIAKQQKKLNSIINRKNDIEKDIMPFALKISKTFEKENDVKNSINEIVFSAYKIALPNSIIEDKKQVWVDDFLKIHVNELEVNLFKHQINNVDFTNKLLPAYLILHLENYVLDLISDGLKIDTLEFLKTKYSTIASGKYVDKTSTLVKKDLKPKNTKSTNPFLVSYVFNCELKGKFLDIDFEVSGKFENKKLSFASEFIFNKQDQKALSVEQLKSNFNFDLTFTPSVETTDEENEVVVKLFYSDNSYYAIVQYSSYQIHVGIGEKKFLITQFDVSKQKSDAYSILKDEFGLNKVFLLIQDPGALSENNKLLEDFIKEFNITIEEEGEEDVIETPREEFKVDKNPFEKSSSIKLQDAKFALAAQISNDLDSEVEKGLVPSIMDFIGAEQIDFYGVYKDGNGQGTQQEFFLCIDKIGNPDRFFSVSNFSINWFKKPDNTGFVGRADLNFKIDDNSEPFTVGAVAGFSKKSMYFGAELKRDISFSGGLVLKNVAATIGYSRRTRSATFGIAGMIEGNCIGDEDKFNLQGATSFSVLGNTIRPTLLAAAATSTSDDGVTLADFIYGTTTLNLSFVPTLGLLKIQDIELTQVKSNSPKVIVEDLNLTEIVSIEDQIKYEADINSNKEAIIANFNKVIPIKDFRINEEYSITEIGKSKNYLVTDKSRMIHYKITNTGGINLVSQFYACIEETTIGSTTYSPGLFVAGQLNFLGQEAKFIFDVNQENKTFTAALTISPIKILGGLLEFKYFENNKFEKIKTPESLQLFSDEDKPADKRGPVMFCSYGGSLDSLKMYINADLSLFWGFSKLQTELKVADSKIEAYVNYKFAIFTTSLIYKADVNTFGNGNFYLKLDLEVESLNKKLKDLADQTRKAADDAKAKLDASTKDLINKEAQRNRIYKDIEYINKEIDRLKGLKNVFKRAALRIEKGIKYVEYGVICLAVKVLEGAVTVLKAAITVGSSVVGGVLDAAAWVVEKIGQIFSIDSLILELDYRVKNDAHGNKSVKFKAEADYTILGHKANPKLDLEINFSKDIFGQILDQLSNKAKTIKEEIDQNNGVLPEKYRRDEIKLPISKDEKIENSVAPTLSENENIIESTTEVIQKHNQAIDSLYTLLVENDFVKEYIDKGPSDSDDIVFWEMTAMRERIETLPKESFVQQLNNVFTGNTFQSKKVSLDSYDGNDELSRAIQTMSKQIDQLSNSLNKPKDQKIVDLAKVSSEKQIRREFVKYFNDYMNDSE